jgi:hypothetical protein
VNEIPVGSTVKEFEVEAKIGRELVLVSLKNLKVKSLPTHPEGIPVTSIPEKKKAPAFDAFTKELCGLTVMELLPEQETVVVRPWPNSVVPPVFREIFAANTLLRVIATTRIAAMRSKA